MNRRKVITGLAAVSLAAPGLLRFARAGTAGVPSLPGVSFVTPDMASSRDLSVAYNMVTQKTPALRAMCRTPEGVANVLKWARDTGRDFAVRSAGHCFAGLSQHDGLVIDSRPFADIRVDPEKQRVTAGAGAWIGWVYKALAQHGLALAGGSYPSVGVAGNTLGGGVGFLSRRDGLLCDRLESVSLVDAQGRTVTASKDENPDLFWACRGGGGGSFGVVTDFTFRASPVERAGHIAVTVRVPFRRAARIIAGWQYWTEEMGRDTTTHMQFSRYTLSNDFVITLTGLTLSPRERVLDSLRELFGDVPESAVTTYPWDQAIEHLHDWHHLITPEILISKSDYVATPMSVGAVEKVLEVLTKYPVGGVKTTWEALAGAVGDIGPADTAYPHRDARFVIHYKCDIFRLTQYLQQERGIREYWQAMRPYVTGGAYVNYPDPELFDWARAYWGANLPRLQQVKTAWDPDNVFRHAQSVPPLA